MKTLLDLESRDLPLREAGDGGGGPPGADGGDRPSGAPSAFIGCQEGMQRLIPGLGGPLMFLLNAGEIRGLPRLWEDPGAFLRQLGEVAAPEQHGLQTPPAFLDGPQGLAARGGAGLPSRPLVMWIEERGQSAWVQEAVVGQLTPAVSLERVGDLPTALRKLSTRAYDLVLTGYDLEGGTGLDLLQSVRRHPAWIPTLVLTQRGNETVASHVMEAGGAGYLGCESLREDGRIIRAARRVLGEAALMRNWEGMLQQMHTLAISDSLTATYNRHFIGQLLEMELRRSQRYGHPFCVALIDVDGFKEINDRFGHGYGDGVLRELARLLKDQLRATDHLGRFGGDEMLVILPQTTLANARHLCRRMSQRVARHAFGTASGEALRITLSIGVSDWGGGPGVSTAQLLEDADRALYRAKLEGRNRVCHCGPGDGAPVAPTAIPRRTFPCAAGASCPLQAGRR